MKLKLGELYAAWPALDKLSKTEHLAAKYAYRVGALKKEIAGRLEEFEKARAGLVERFAQKDEKGQPKRTEKGDAFLLADAKGFEKEFKDLCDEEVIVKYEALVMPPENTGLTGDDYAALGELVKVD